MKWYVECQQDPPTGAMLYRRTSAQVYIYIWIRPKPRVGPIKGFYTATRPFLHWTLNRLKPVSLAHMDWAFGAH